MEASKERLNNRGATLIMVLVCMLFVGIIASAILVLVTNNLEISKTEKHINATFYNAEGAADQVRTLLQEYANTAINNAYTRWLQQYSIGEQAAGEVYSKLFVEEMLSALETNLLGTPLGDIEEDATSFSYDRTKLGELKNLIGDDHAEWADSDSSTLQVLIENGGIRIKDVAIKYTDDDGNITMVTTDIVFKPETPKFLVNSLAGQNLNIAYYTLIANGNITNVTDVIFNGSIYSGSNLYLSKNVSAYAQYIVAKNNIQIEPGASITVKGVKGAFGDSYSDNKLWTNNITLLNNSKMDMKGSVYLADDLTLEDSSEFTLTGDDAESGFYGYNISDASLDQADPNSVKSKFGTPKGSSAIVINGKDVKLNLAAANHVWIAGKAFIDIGSVKNDAGADALCAPVAFPEGESIALKGQQAAYLLPGECIPSVGHNPMTREEFLRLYTDDAYANTNDGTEFVYRGFQDIDLNKVLLSGNSLVEEYVNAEMPFRPAFIVYGGAKLVYLYLNFKSLDAAAKYFKEYSTNESTANLVNGRMSFFGTAGQILLPTSGRIDNSGNIMAFNEGKLTVTEANLRYTGADSDFSAALSKKFNLSRRFRGLYNGLSENYTGVAENVTDTILNMDLFSEGEITIYKADESEDYSLKIPNELILKAPGHADMPYDIEGALPLMTGVYSFRLDPSDNPGDYCLDRDGNHRNDDLSDEFYTNTRYDEYRDEVEKYRLFVAKGKVKISGNGNGIVVAGGDVEITSGNFKGLIIAGGKITISGGAHFTADPIIVSTIMQNSKLMRVLFNLDTAVNVTEEDGKMISGLIMINFENWRKN